MRVKNRVQFFAAAWIAVGMFSANVWAQKPSDKTDKTQAPALADVVEQLQAQVRQLQSAVQEIKQESERYRSETQELKRELESTRQKLDSMNRPATTTPAAAEGQTAQTAQATAAPTSIEQRVAKLEEDAQVTDARVTEQYQTKVESASKYRVRLSGLLLFNLFSNTGNVDHLEIPSVILPASPSLTAGNTGGSFGGTFRQSQFGLEVYGPDFAGAKTRADFVADFLGEFPETVNGGASGALRIRTGTVRLDWAKTSVVGGMDSIFFSPTYPTSFASLGVPALSYSGNLWGWFPQLRVEHRLMSSDASTVTLYGGIFDPLTGETPPNEFLRVPTAGEASRQPGYGGRVEWERKIGGEPMTLGLGGAYNRENWGFERNVDGWVVNGDWGVPLGTRFRVSGKIYSGKAIGGFGAAIGRSIVFTSPATCATPNNPLLCPQTAIQPLRAAGGWVQLKFKPAAKVEFNAAGGQDGTDADDLRALKATLAPGYFGADITRNRSGFVNVIYRPRSNLLFSSEFRTLRTFAIDGTSLKGSQFNLVMGVFF